MIETHANDALLEVRELCVEFATASGAARVVHELDLTVNAGRTLAIVGESGSGKSVTSLAIMRLAEYTGGRMPRGQVQLRLDSGAVDLSRATQRQMRRIRGRDVAMIFQEPMTSLNPVFTVGSQIREVLRLHRGLRAGSANAEARRLLSMVRLADAGSMLRRYPHELSGGMRQRVMIAMALACQPRVLIADEPTTALDVTIQAQILAILRDLQRELGMAIVFITHDMGVVSQIADDVIVMREGRKLEEGAVERVFDTPHHAYTQSLLQVVPKLGAMTGEALPRRQVFSVLADDGPKWMGEDRVHDTVRTGSGALLSVAHLAARFDVRRTLLGRVTHRVHAAEDVSFEIYPGETLALVGESGSGKSTVGRIVQGLQQASAGSVALEGQPVERMDAAERRALRRDIQYIFQDPFASLDPRQTIGFSVAEPIRTHNLLRGERRINERVAELLVKVGLEPAHAGRYPHQFSGGQRQRACIARALACDPKLIIADEALSSLDVSVQAQIIDLLMSLQQETGLAYLFISHDMGVVERMAHRVAVLYLGQIVELGTRQAVFERPSHAYTRRLLAAVPVANPAHRAEIPLLEGEVPSPVRAVGDEPAILAREEVAPGHLVAEDSPKAAPTLLGIQA